MSQSLSFGSNIFKKILLYGTGILLIIVFLYSSLISIKEKSLRPLIVNFGQRILATDSYIYNKMEELKANPDKLYYQAYVDKVNNMYSADSSKFEIEIAKTNGFWFKIKYFFNRFFIYFDLILSIWFLFTIFYMFYWFSGHVLIGHSDNVFGSFMIAIIIFITINLIFTFMLYDAHLYRNRNYLDLTMQEQVSLLNPFKGITNILSNIPFLIQKSYYNIVVPIEESKESDNKAEKIIAKTLG